MTSRDTWSKSQDTSSTKETFVAQEEMVPGCYAGLGVGTHGSKDRLTTHRSDYLLDDSGLSAGLVLYLSLLMNFDRCQAMTSTAFEFS